MDGIISVGSHDMPAIHRIAGRVPLALVRNAVPSAGDPVSDESLRPSALWVARLAYPKDPLMAVAAWERVASRIPEAKLTICGTGPLEPELRERLGHNPSDQSVAVTGFVADLAPFVKEASIFFLVSKVEGGISMATLEAMGQGLVPVVTDVGDAELLSRFDCGVVAGSYDPDSIAAAVIEMMSDPQRFKVMRRNAIAYASKGRSVDDMVEETLAFYGSVADRAHVRIG
jgi:glycosyltransferase involved in cell wall biosynthesis